MVFFDISNGLEDRNFGTKCSLHLSSISLAWLTYYDYVSNSSLMLLTWAFHSKETLSALLTEKWQWKPTPSSMCRPMQLTTHCCCWWFPCVKLLNFHHTVKPWYSGLARKRQTVHYFKDSTISNHFEYWKLQSIKLKRRKKPWNCILGIIKCILCSVLVATYLDINDMCT